MNRRFVLLGTAITALAAFAGGKYWVDQKELQNAKAEAEKQALAAAEDTVLVRPHSPIIGNPKASVTIVEFFDPSCEACRAFHPFVKAIVEENGEKVRVVLRYTALHQGSDEAVRILETARLQNVFEPVLGAILDRQPEWAMHDGPNLETAWSIAGEAGLDVAKGKIDRMQPGIVSVLNTDAADVATVGIQQTPTFFVNGKPLTDFGPEGLRALVKTEVDAL